MISVESTGLSIVTNEAKYHVLLNMALKQDVMPQ